MKMKVPGFIMAGTFFAAFGCSAQSGNIEKVTAEPSKILVAYYSWSGNTRYAAEQIAKTTGADLLEIKPETPYPADYNACVNQAKDEISKGVRPKLAPIRTDIKKYDVIFIGSPNWWGTMAPPVATFLASYDLAGKTVIPFFTHGGGGMQNCERDVRRLCAKANVLPAKTFSGGSVKSHDEDIAKFANDRVKITAVR